MIYQYYNYDSSIKKSIDAGYNYFDVSKSSIKAYAEKIGAEYLFIDKEIPISPFYGIFLPFTEGWCEEYDAVCFIDSDILATTHSENILEYSSDSIISAHCLSSNHIKNKSLKEVQYFIENGVINTGVVIFPRETYQTMIDATKNIKDYHENIDLHHESLGSMDQAFINFLIRDNGMKYNNLSREFNYNLSRYPYKDRFENYLIHYHRGFKRRMRIDILNSLILLGEKPAVQHTTKRKRYNPSVNLHTPPKIKTKRVY